MALLVVGAVLASTNLSVSPASAAVGAGASFSVPFGAAVGSTGLPASIRVVNQNTSPNQGEGNTINEILFIPSCGSNFGNAANPCPTPDSGVFTLSATGAGAANTACAGRTFNVAGPTPIGGFTFTVAGAPVVLAPPGPSLSDECTVNFTMSIVKVPAIDVSPPDPGAQTRTNLKVRVTSASGLSPTPFVTQVVPVSQGFPGLTTQASPSVAAGGSIFDTATVTRASPVAAAPTGTVTFRVFGPNNAGCTGGPIGQSTNPVAANGQAVSASFVAGQPGVYRFVAVYNGDVNYVSRTSPCNAAGESVNVTPAPADAAVADFDGNGTTDLALFRPSNGRWLVRNILDFPFGVSTDIPVPADYNGDGRTEVAVFRPSTGRWFVQGQPALRFGLSTDIPVPGDYNGDGRDELAVFRPSTGQWFVYGQGPVTFGASGDTPVPGDYNGDNRDELAVFRPAGAIWLIQGMPAVAYGASTDIPVPGDYNDDGRTDIALYRAAGASRWFVRGQPTVSFGTTGDLPQPGDYNGDGRTDVAVFRPSTGHWIVPGITDTSWGLSTDVPLPLPYAIRRTIPMP